MINSQCVACTYSLSFLANFYSKLFPNIPVQHNALRRKTLDLRIKNLSRRRSRIIIIKAFFPATKPDKYLENFILRNVSGQFTRIVVHLLQGTSSFLFPLRTDYLSRDGRFESITHWGSIESLSLLSRFLGRVLTLSKYTSRKTRSGLFENLSSFFRGGGQD